MKPLNVKIISLLFYGILGFLCTITFYSYQVHGEIRKPSNQSGKPDAKRIYEQVAPPFIKNQGHIKNDLVQFYLNSTGKTLFFTESCVIMNFYKINNHTTGNHPVMKNRTNPKPANVKGVVIRQSFLNANIPSINGESIQPGKVNYFVGNRENWKKGIPTFQELVYEEIYPGINLRYISFPGNLKYQFEVAPGGNPRMIKLEFSGIDKIFIDDDGNLIIRTGMGDIVDKKPNAYQIINNHPVIIYSKYKVFDNKTFGFTVDYYDTGYPLVIDPVVY